MVIKQKIRWSNFEWSHPLYITVSPHNQHISYFVFFETQILCHASPFRKYIHWIKFIGGITYFEIEDCSAFSADNSIAIHTSENCLPTARDERNMLDGDWELRG